MAVAPNKMGLKLLPYHYEFNLIWADINVFVADHNSIYVEQKMWTLHKIIQQQIEQFVINVNENDTTRILMK